MPTPTQLDKSPTSNTKAKHHMKNLQINRRSVYPNKTLERVNDPQFVLTGRIEPNNGGGEMIKFALNLGFFQLKFIVNVPGDGECEAPVYVKFKVRNPKLQHKYEFVDSAAE